MKNRLLILLTFAIVQVSFGQNYKIGQGSKEDLQEKAYPLDASADAAYLYKNRKTYFEFVEGDGYVVITEVHERIKIYTVEGYNWATKSIRYYNANSSGNSDKLSIKGAKTYTLKNGKIETIKLSNKEIFNEEINKYYSRKKFTMPDITEGCVVEWSYKLTSKYKEINDVVMQYEIPIKKFDLNIEIPEYYIFSKKHVGYLPIKIKENKQNKKVLFAYRSKEQSVRGIPSNSKREKNFVDVLTTYHKLEKNNIPALSKEPYVNNINNYRSLIKYELASIKWPNEPAKNYAQTWEDVARTIFKNSNFGGQLEKTGHLNDDVTELKSKLTTLPTKLFGALDYVKSKIKWNGNYGKYAEKGLRKAYKEGVGNIGDINLTLVAVLNELGINANPVLVSTRSHGVPVFPTLSGFNYVIVVAETSQGLVLLDASEKYSLPNILPLRVMNWNGTIVRKDQTVGFVDLASSMKSVEELSLSYKISVDGIIEGLSRNIYSDYAALKYRNSFGNLKEETIISKIEEKSDDIEILNFRLSNINNMSKPVIELYKFEKEEGIEIIGDKMYITPMLFETTDENPFKIDTREYPIDFGMPWEEKINISVSIPEGYKVESLPENIAKGMSEDLGSFIYSLKNESNKIQITSIIKINQGVISASYYQEIKEMFKQIVSKQTEKIVLSKN
jgi:hypothetical protein